MSKNKQKKNFKWIAIGVVAALLASPNNSLAKYALNEIDPITFLLIRTLGIAIIAVPIILFYVSKFNRSNIKYSLIAGLCMTLSSASFMYAIELGEANFVTILSLASPIVLVALSSMITGEIINKNAKSGVVLAALGAFVIVFSPIFFAGDVAVRFFPESAALVGVYIVCFPLSIIYSKKAASNGLPIFVTLGIAAVVTFMLSCIWHLLSSLKISQVSPDVLLVSVYSGVVVMFLARILDIVSYKHLGSAILGGLFYLELFVALLFTNILLGEQLATTSLIGGAIILFGIYIAESHKTKHFGYHHILKRH